MATKGKLTLPIDSQGNTIELPAWATETTLEAIYASSTKAVSITRDMMSTARKIKDSDQTQLDALNEVVEGVKINAETAETVQKTRVDTLLKGVKKVNDVASFFGDAEKPLTSLVGAAGKLVKSLDGPKGKGGMAKLAKNHEGFAKMFTKFGGFVDVASDVALAWMGWNAAKFEQFAETQKKMIDSGAIFYETSKDFDQLYEDSFRAGVTYNAFADTIQNFGGTMTALGGDVSMGSRSFIHLFKRLSDTSNSLGDMGMQNKEMMEIYANYIEVQRLTGGLDRQLANGGELLEKSFQDLVVESTALASLTSLNRGDALQRQMAALSDTFAAAGLEKLRDQGLGKTADAASSFIKQMSLIADQGPASGMMQEFVSVFNKNLYEYSDDISKFNVRLGLSENTRGAFDKVMPEFLDKVNTMVRDGEIGAEEASNWVVREFANMDQQKLATAGAGAGTMLAAIQEMQDSGFMINKNFGKWVDLTETAMNTKIEETKAKMDTAGSTVEAMNDASKMFLTAQEAITLPLNSLSTSIESVSKFFTNNSEKMKDWSAKFWEKVGLGGAVDGDGNIIEKVDKDQGFEETSVKVNRYGIKDTSTPGGPMPGGGHTTGTTSFDASMIESKNLPSVRDRLTEEINSAIIIDSTHPGAMSKEMAAKQENKRLLQLQLDTITRRIEVERNIANNRQAYERILHNF